MVEYQGTGHCSWGRMAVASVEGQGVPFTIMLPLLDDAADPVRSLSVARPSPAE